MNSTLSFLVFLFAFLASTNSVYSQPSIGGEVSYVYGPSKEAFSGKFILGDEIGDFRVGIGGGFGKFNSNPNDRLLSYYDIRLSPNYTFFLDSAEEAFGLYLGLDIEYLKITKVLDTNRISIFPVAGIRLFNVGFIEIGPDNLNEPNEGGRLFKFDINSFRINIGFHYLLY